MNQIQYTTISSCEAHAKKRAHLELLSPIVEDFRRSRMVGIKHPVYDFLFSYYSFTSGQLLRWSPGVGSKIRQGCDSDDFDKTELISEWPDHYKTEEDLLFLDVSKIPLRRMKYLKWAINYLERSGERSPVFHCFGLHEWAMVYKATDRHHPETPLRFLGSEIEEIVDSNQLCCTHYDAFRFFTPAASVNNKFKLNRESVIESDQPGCIHANMDLYKFGYKIAPYISSELLANLFLLARRAREIDMRASPYDLLHLNMQPIKIETQEGKEEYLFEQKRIFLDGQILRSNLLNEYLKIYSELSVDFCF